VKQTRDSSQGKSTDTSQEGWLDPENEIQNHLPSNLTLMSGGGVVPAGMYEYGSHYDTQYRRHIEDNQRMQQKQTEEEQYKRGTMIHQPNSLDSLDGEAALPFDPVPIRYESENMGPEAMSTRAEDPNTNISYR